jgi:major intracellular serine protease
MSSSTRKLLQLPTYTVDAIHTLDVQASTTQRLIPKGISSSAFERIWQAGFTGKDVIVAVVDTGIDGSVSDLKDKVIKSINLTGEPLGESHGTHVSGTIAANGWLIGGAYDAKLLDIKVIGKSGGSIDNIVKAIGLATSNGASIVNMSLGGTGLSNQEIQALTNAIQDAWNQGCICIAAAGNDGTSVCTPDAYEYPASIEKAESIAACNVSDDLSGITLAAFSNENNRVDMAACGVNVISCIIGGQYGIYSGTSMATPHVSAMAAVLTQYIRSKYPDLKGSSFSANLVSLLHSNVLAINNCGTNAMVTVGNKTLVQQKANQVCPQQNTQAGYNSALSGQTNILYSNISFGLGFLRYEPTNGPYTPNGTPYYNSNIFLGTLVNQ